MRIDVAASIAAQEDWLARCARRSVVRGPLRGYIALGRYATARKLGFHESAVFAGLSRAWFDEFAVYWEDVLGGRPLTIADFHGLRMLYRMRGQIVEQLDWGSVEQHVANWQRPESLSMVFESVYRSALRPVRSRILLRAVRSGMRVLEFGCGIAPAYGTWRRYLSHRSARWVLADIPGFLLHYARHVHGHDAEAQFVVITPDRLADPLADIDGGFDLVIVQEVFEHLHRPRLIAEYLVERLRRGGLILFDYIAGEPVAHNTPAGQEERLETLAYLDRALEIVGGAFAVSDKSLGTCLGRKARG